MAEDPGAQGGEHGRMKQPGPVRRYTLARTQTAAKPRPEEGVRRLRLVRMEAIADQDREREREPPERARP